MSSQNSSTGSTVSALSSIAPAIASTACCWGPAALGVFGAGGSTSATHFSQIARFRPHLLAVSATMISFSFYRVYGPPSKQELACCKNEVEKRDHARKLNVNRAVVWLSLCVALAGASYGRVQLPKISKIGLGAGSSSGMTCSVGPLKMQVQGMRCGGCSNKVQRAIQNVDGVQKVVVDYQTGAATIEGKNVNEAAIKNAIEKAGYVAS